MLAFLLVFIALAVASSIIIQGFYKRTDIYAAHPVVDDIVGGLLGLLQGFVVLTIMIIILNSHVPPEGAGQVTELSTAQDATPDRLEHCRRDPGQPRAAAGPRPVAPAAGRRGREVPLSRTQPGPDAAVAGPPFPRPILAQDTVAAARALLGARLVRIEHSSVRVAKIVEVEAYLGGDDLASHARRGRTPRNAAMFGPPGHAYVYLVYGMYECLNVVTEAVGRAAAVLVRAVEPVAGEELMREARIAWLDRWEERVSARQGSDEAMRAALAGRRRAVGALAGTRLASGPGLVCAALSIGRELDGADLCDPAASLSLRVAPAGEPAPEIASGPRVGVGYAPEPWRSMPLRFWSGSGGGSR